MEAISKLVVGVFKLTDEMECKIMGGESRRRNTNRGRGGEKVEKTRKSMGPLRR